MTPGAPERRLLAILIGDVAGYSRLMAADEDGTLCALDALRETISRIAGEHHGRVVHFTGDQFLADFTSAVNAVQCALEIQRALGERNMELPAGRRMEFRIGGHLGEVRVEAESIFGDGVNIAARLEAMAEPGGLCISRMLLEQVEGKIALAVEDLGEQSVKNLPRPVHTYRVRPAAPAPQGNTPAPSGPRDHTVGPPQGLPTVAVLPFANLSNDPEQEYLADGMTIDVTTGLSCDKRLVVIAHHSTMRYKGQAPDVREVGVALGARYVVEGSVRRLGPRVRVTTALVDVETRREVWAGRVDRNVEEIFDVLDEVTEGILTALASNLRLAEVARFRRTPPDQLDAWALCMRAHVSEGPAGDRLGWVRRALEIDPGFAFAWGLLGYLTALKFPVGISTDRAADVTESLQATERALLLEPGDPAALTFRAVALQYAGRAAESIDYLERSLRLNPNDVLTHLYYGRGLMFTGRPEPAVAHFERFERLNPNDPRAYHAGMYHALALVFLHRWAEAEQAARAAIAASGGHNAWSWMTLILALAGLGKTDEAVEAVARLRGLMPWWTRAFVQEFLRKTQQDPALAEPVCELLCGVWPDDPPGPAPGRHPD